VDVVQIIQISRVGVALLAFGRKGLGLISRCDRLLRRNQSVRLSLLSDGTTGAC